MSDRPGAAPAARRTVVLAALAALALVLGGLGLARAGSGLTVRHATVSGVPLTEVRAATGGDRRPGVVVAHGFAGSARLMRPIADTLARRGAVAVLVDFAGHGANPARLPGAGRGTADSALAHDLDVAVAYLRGRPDVDPARITLVGHSMGAGAVTRYAAGHPDVARTVAISLPDGDGLPDGRPAGLLLIVGGAEFPDFRDTAERTYRRGGGTGRRLVVVPGVEHISVLFAGRTHAEIAAWVPGGGAEPARPAARLVPAGLLLLGFGIGFVPLVDVLLGRRRRAARTGRVVPARWVPPLAVGGAVVGVLLGAVAPTARLPLAVGGYVTGFLLFTGLSLVAAARWWPVAGRTRAAPGGAVVAAAAPGTPAGAPPVAGVRPPVAGVRPPVAVPFAAVLVTGYAVAAVAVPIHLGLTSALPVGARWWLLPVVALGALAFLAGAERLAAGRSRWYAAVGMIAVLVLTGAAVVGPAPGFVLLVVPLFAVLVGWQAAWAAVLRRAGAPAWLPPLVGATMLAWPIATTLPLG